MRACPNSKPTVYTDAELEAEFDHLFPQGFAGPDVIAEIAPDGWQNSPLLAVNHPSPRQLYEEALQFHRALCALQRPNDPRPIPPEPKLMECDRDCEPPVIETDTEVRELVGQCLWDVFSDNHEVLGPDGRVLDLGSFRGSGGFVADVLNRQLGTAEYDYLSFYLGTIHVARRADLTPVYQMIFRRLRRRALDWHYEFPRLYVIDMRPLKEALDAKDETEWTNYSPSETLVKDEEQRQHDRELAEFRESLDEDHRDAVTEAQNQPPPAIVRAYRLVYGHFPRGWPPTT